jgi:hypothetical protein
MSMLGVCVVLALVLSTAAVPLSHGFTGGDDNNQARGGTTPAVDPVNPYVEIGDVLSDQVSLHDAMRIAEDGTTVHSACQDDGVTPLGTPRSGTITKVTVDAAPSGVTITWDDNTTSLLPPCNMHLYTTSASASSSQCTLRAQPKFFNSPIMSPQPSNPGWIDTHNHMFAYMSFGGRMMYGAALGDMAEALKPCDGDSSHAFLPGFMPANVNISKIVERIFSCDGKDIPTHYQKNGYPTFEHWPRWNDAVHQQSHVDWLREAHADGQRAVLISFVNNELICEIFREFGIKPQYNHSGACDDLTNVKYQQTAAVQMLRENSVCLCLLSSVVT